MQNEWNAKALVRKCKVECENKSEEGNDSSLSHAFLFNYLNILNNIFKWVKSGLGPRKSYFQANIWKLFSSFLVKNFAKVLLNSEFKISQ